MMSRVVLPSLSIMVAFGVPMLAQADRPLSEVRDDAIDPQTIYGGEISGPCSWPTTVHLNGCTGSLVHPQVVIYAAHCGAQHSEVYFGQKGAGGTVATANCQTFPEYGGSTLGVDFAFCVLAEPVEDIPLVPILMGDEVDILQANTPVTIVGFGGNDIGAECGLKLEAETIFHEIDQDEALVGGRWRRYMFW